MFRMSVAKMLLGTYARMFSRKYAWQNLLMFALLFQEMYARQLKSRKSHARISRGKNALMLSSQNVSMSLKMNVVTSQLNSVEMWPRRNAR